MIVTKKERIEEAVDGEILHVIEELRKKACCLELAANALALSCGWAQVGIHRIDEPVQPRHGR